MFGSIVYIIYGLIQIGFLVIAWRLWQAHRYLFLLLLTSVVLGLAYDNLIIGLGSAIGESDLLATLNIPRYLFHAFLTPTMMAVGYCLARIAGVPWVRKPTVPIVIATLVMLMVALGTYTDVVRLALEAAFDNGTVRYANENTVGPPIPAIITVIVLIVFGVAIFRRQRWPWLMVGAIIMFFASAGGSALGLLTNIGEVALTASLVLTAQKLLASEGMNSAEITNTLIRA